jgi:acyl phosphate:glycerol-3-phosphate acyltransferase
VESLLLVLMANCAFWLGVCPFSLWIGQWFLHKDIRHFGDGNPGAVNAFLAGGRKIGGLALIMDVGKWIPFVFVAHSVFQLPQQAIAVIGTCAIIGHAFSPFLRFHGGKAVAVTFGVLLALPIYQPFLSLTIATFLAFILIDNDAWTVVIGAVTSFVYLLISQGNSWETRFILFIVILFVIKFFRELQTVPRLLRLINWLQAKR